MLPPTRGSVPVVRRVRPAREAARLPGGVLSGVRHCFDQNRALFVFLGIARNGTAKLPAFAAVKEPLGPANGDDHFAFGARHLHPPNMHQIRSVPSQTRRELGIYGERRTICCSPETVRKSGGDEFFSLLKNGGISKCRRFNCCNGAWRRHFLIDVLRRSRRGRSPRHPTLPSLTEKARASSARKNPPVGYRRVSFQTAARATDPQPSSS